MKSIEQMHNEILIRANFDGGWPRAVIVGPGIIALAKNKYEYERLCKSSAFATLAGVILGLVISVLIIHFN